MITVEKNYHFYAAHRNERLENTKCANMHGHSYMVTFKFAFDNDDVDELGVTIPFETFDSVIEPIIKDTYCHSTFVNTEDVELCDCIAQFPKVFGKVVYFKGPTSVENLARKLFETICKTKLGAIIDTVSVKETTSSLVSYNSVEPRMLPE